MESSQPESLADRLIADQFAVHGADLVIGGHAALDLAQAFGTPLFVYDAGLIRRTYRALAATLDGFAAIHYSIKANPNPAIVSVLLEEGAGLEIASLGEFQAGLAAGADPARILFAGPGKRANEIDAVVAAGIGEIHLETEEEITRVAAAGARHGRRVAVSIRVNPVAEVQGGAMRMGGKPAPFGFDEEAIRPVIDRILAQPHLDLQGVHMFAGTQILDAGVLAAQWRHGLDVATTIATHIGRPLRAIDLGGGLGIPYFTGDKALDLAQLKTEVAALIAHRQSEPLIRDAKVLVEPGRYLVGPAGVYLMGVNAVKTSRGQRFLIMDGGMHHHLAASGNLGQIVKRDYPVVPASRMDDGDLQPAAVVGPLCTPLDTLARKAMLPSMVADDLIAVLQSGAYGLSASPGGFLSHPAPTEVLVDGAGARRIN
jgi:diaminopimelate decarboxylase